MLFDHVEFQVLDFQKSLAFYQAVLAPLHCRLISCNLEKQIAKFGQKDSIDFLIQGGCQTKPTLHIAFRASSFEEVHQFYNCALANGGKDNGAPGFRSQYRPNYYAAFVFDPDGHNIEVLYRS